MMHFAAVIVWVFLLNYVEIQFYLVVFVLHKKWNFTWTSLVNMTKSAVSDKFGHIFWKTVPSFFVQSYYVENENSRCAKRNVIFHY